VTEADYWVKLELRVCRELEGMEDRAVRSLWCDGSIPEQYLLDDPTPRVTGRAWIGTGPRKQDRWELSLFLDNAARTRGRLLGNIASRRRGNRLARCRSGGAATPRHAGSRGRRLTGHCSGRAGRSLRSFAALRLEEIGVELTEGR
jgi:hypothetical protein